MAPGTAKGMYGYWYEGKHYSLQQGGGFVQVRDPEIRDLPLMITYRGGPLVRWTAPSTTATEDGQLTCDSGASTHYFGDWQKVFPNQPSNPSSEQILSALHGMTIMADRARQPLTSFEARSFVLDLLKKAAADSAAKVIAQAKADSVARAAAAKAHTDSVRARAQAHQDSTTRQAAAPTRTDNGATAGASSSEPPPAVQAVQQAQARAAAQRARDSSFAAEQRRATAHSDSIGRADYEASLRNEADDAAQQQTYTDAVNAAVAPLVASIEANNAAARAR